MTGLHELAAFFVSVGLLGAGIAALCAIVAGVALARDAAGLCGGATAVWICGMLLSLAAGFSAQWMPTAAAGASLIVMLVLGGVVRAMLNGRDRRLTPEVSVQATAQITGPEATAPTTAPVTRPRSGEVFGGATQGAMLVQQ